MNEQYEEVKAEDLNPGDVVHVSFKSGSEQNLFLNKKVIGVRDSHVKAQGMYYFYKEYSRFYLVEKAERKLPTEIGAVVKHPDGWQFIRIGEDSWRAVDPRNGLSSIRWRDAEVAIVEGWEVVA